MLRALRRWFSPAASTFSVPGLRELVWSWQRGIAELGAGAEVVALEFEVEAAPRKTEFARGA